MHRHSLPVASPCSVAWESMIPAGDNRRLCERCSKHVHFLSGMTEEAAERLLAEHRARGESLCIRYEVASDGEIRFATELRPALGFVILVALGVTMLTACTDPSALSIDDDDQRPPLVWVEVEPKPTVPDLALPAAPSVAPDAAETSSLAKRRAPRKQKSKKPKFDMVQGAYPLGPLDEF